jgi:DNA repair protein RecO (recombination protein O)
VAGRTTKTEAVVLRSLRLGEADRVLHLYTLEHGRLGAVAKGIRRTKSRFGARLEPLSHVELMVHQGRGELGTVTGVQLIRPHHAARADSYRLGVGLVGAEAMLRLFTEQEPNPRAFEAITRFLDLVDVLDSRAPARPALDPLALAFQLKLLWLSGYAPHLGACAECAEPAPLVAYSARAGGGVCADCAEGALPVSRAGFEAIEGMLRRPLAEAAEAVASEQAARQALAVITASYEFHGGFRLRTLSA